MIDRIEGMGESMGPQAEMLREQALEYAAVARERLSEGMAGVKLYVAREPVRALGIAVGMGVLLGWMIKRR